MVSSFACFAGIRARTLAGHHGNPRTRTHTTSCVASGVCSTVDASSTGWVRGGSDACTSSSPSSWSAWVSFSFLFSLPPRSSSSVFTPFVFVLVGVTCDTWWVIGVGWVAYLSVHVFPWDPLVWSVSLPRAWCLLPSFSSIVPPRSRVPSTGVCEAPPPPSSSLIPHAPARPTIRSVHPPNQPSPSLTFDRSPPLGGDG